MSDKHGGQFLQKYLRCFDEESQDKAEKNWEYRQNREFENSQCTLTQIGMFCKFETCIWLQNYRKIMALGVQKAEFWDSKLVIS